MKEAAKPEVWLRGPLPDIPALLQPVAHALLQSQEEAISLLAHFPDALLWERPAGLASPAFHLQHVKGVLDRLFTYAREEALNEDQLSYLAAEGQAYPVTAQELLQAFGQQVNRALQQLKETDSTRLTEVRVVGRSRLPSTLLGLYVHAAEHTMRHLGQLLVTVRVLQQQASPPTA